MPISIRHLNQMSSADILCHENLAVTIYRYTKTTK